MVRIGVVGLGKMGISHLSIIGAHPAAEVAAVCDSLRYVLDVLAKYTAVTTFTSWQKMFATADLDAVIISTPTAAHAEVARAALEAGLHVFCEKPLTLSPSESEALAALAAASGLVTQVGYHNRFVATFVELERLVRADAIGRVTHALAESYGPVVLQPKGSTWRSRRTAGGGCLYDYAAHPIDLLQWLFGEPTAVRGTVLSSVFSADTDDEVYSTLEFAGAVSAQLSVNWSDESLRKMTTKMSVWGTLGKLTADRQELTMYRRDAAPTLAGYGSGWSVRYTTDLTPPVAFYLRGEEYSAQLDAFITSIEATGASANRVNGFASAAATDRIIDRLLVDAASRTTATATA